MNERSQAAALLFEVTQRALNPSEWSDVEGWIDMRSEEEGGFLWLAAALGMQPKTIEKGLRLLIGASPLTRSRLRQKLLKNGNAERH